MEGKENEIFLDWITRKYFFKDKKYSDLNIYQKGDIGEFLRFPTTKNAYIIEWFDTEGIYITIDFTKPYWYCYIMTSGFGCYSMSENEFLTRRMATEAAIKKAVEIFNEKYKENEQ
ncbi:hypothetical protein FCL53_16990 [Elizabethkingia meningoseptica]|uniref:hypothetical protein n=1 Tax=Elizabethkingia meningoseptica TaxID=238 RepID=UPI001365B757|nr:hypothetical protein [Elizabethkingia meningoseptica]MVW93660.1 hypothetical protein [Elizabethkingia meningoseptica]